MTDASAKKREPNWGAGMSFGIVFGVAISVALDNWAFLGIGIALSAVFAYGAGKKPANDESTDDTDGDDPDRPGD